MRYEKPGAALTLAAWHRRVPHIHSAPRCRCSCEASELLAGYRIRRFFWNGDEEMRGEEGEETIVTSSSPHLLFKRFVGKDADTQRVRPNAVSAGGCVWRTKDGWLTIPGAPLRLVWMGEGDGGLDDAAPAFLAAARPPQAVGRRRQRDVARHRLARHLLHPRGKLAGVDGAERPRSVIVPLPVVRASEFS